MCEMSPFNPIDHIQKHGLRCVWAFVYLSMCECVNIQLCGECMCVPVWRRPGFVLSWHRLFLHTWLSSIYTAVCLTFLCSDKSTSPRPSEKEDTFCVTGSVTGAKSSWSYRNVRHRQTHYQKIQFKVFLLNLTSGVYVWINFVYL